MSEQVHTVKSEPSTNISVGFWCEFSWTSDRHFSRRNISKDSWPLVQESLHRQVASKILRNISPRKTSATGTEKFQSILQQKHLSLVYHHSKSSRTIRIDIILGEIVLRTFDATSGKDFFLQEIFLGIIDSNLPGPRKIHRKNSTTGPGKFE